MLRGTQDSSQVGSDSCTGLSPSTVGFSNAVPFPTYPFCRSYNPQPAVASQVWAPPLSLATTHGIIIIFYSYGYLDVSVPRVSLLSNRISRLHLDGLPHSDIRESLIVCISSRLFAAYHVLRLLQEPRHPPYALLSFLALQSFVCQNKYFFISPNLLYFFHSIILYIISQ